MNIILTLLPFVLITTFTPGPNNILVMSQAINYGFNKTINYQIGAFFSNFTLVYGVFCFGSLLEKQMPDLLTIVKYVGVGYLLYLSYVIASSKPHSVNQANRGLSFYNGIIVQFINPKVYLTAFTVAAVILPIIHNYVTLAVIAICISTISIMAMITWASMGSVLQTFLSKWYKQTNIIMALALIWCAYSISQA